MERRRLTENEIDSALRELDDWAVVDGKIAKEFKFKSYANGVMFASAVGHLADSMDHHPDLTIGYQKVSVAVNTHDVGGISPVDFELARRIEGL